MAKQTHPSVARNREHILGELRRILPAEGTVLEIASGYGEHAAYFAEHLPSLAWQPTDPEVDRRESIAAWRAEAGLANLRAPLDLDVTAATWPVDCADAMVCINMVHISPWEATEGLLAGAARVLAPGGPLVLYGAYLRKDRETAPSNLEFDRDLRGRDARWGVRQLEDVQAAASSAGLRFDEVVDMPNNNYTVVFRR